MDQELVQYLDERFHGLVHGLDQRFEGIDRRFDGIDRRFNEVDRKFDGIDQRFDEVDRKFDAVNERIEEVKRHSGVLVEDLRYRLQLVAEGLTMHIQVQHVQEREYFDRKFEDTHALIRTSYGHLQQQQDQLKQSHDQIRQRVENLERREQP
jgi:hypothetical protein